jgi:hypothetical protein
MKMFPVACSLKAILQQEKGETETGQTFPPSHWSHLHWLAGGKDVCYASFAAIHLDLCHYWPPPSS